MRQPLKGDTEITAVAHGIEDDEVGGPRGKCHNHQDEAYNQEPGKSPCGWRGTTDKKHKQNRAQHEKRHHRMFGVIAVAHTDTKGCEAHRCKAQRTPQQSRQRIAGIPKMRARAP